MNGKSDGLIPTVPILFVLLSIIVNLRIQKAIELLKDPANSITWVGYEVGFNDSTHFSRTFKKIVGISPRTYRAIKNSES